MADPIAELNIRLDELRANLAFVAVSAKLRPRIGEATNWNAPGEVLPLVRAFMESNRIRPESVYGAMFVSLMASLERYLRMLIVQIVEKHASDAKTFDDLPPALATRNTVLSGRVLANVETPREYVRMDIESVISNLATCRRGSASFKLNPQVFSVTVTGVNPTTLEDALKTIGLKDWWDGVGGSQKLAEHLGTAGARETGTRARERLGEFCRWRNHLAHGGDDEVALSDEQVRDAIDFIAKFSSALTETARKAKKISR